MKVTANIVSYIALHVITTPTKHVVDVANDDIKFIFKVSILINNTVQNKPP